MDPGDSGSERLKPTRKRVERYGVADSIRADLLEHMQCRNKHSGSYLETRSDWFSVPKQAPQVSRNAIVYGPGSGITSK